MQQGTARERAGVGLDAGERRLVVHTEDGSCRSLTCFCTTRIDAGFIACVGSCPFSLIFLVAAGHVVGLFNVVRRPGSKGAGQRDDLRAASTGVLTQRHLKIAHAGKLGRHEPNRVGSTVHNLAPGIQHVARTIREYEVQALRFQHSIHCDPDFRATRLGSTPRLHRHNVRRAEANVRA